MNPVSLDSACVFLCSKIETLPFKYLCLPVGVNPRLETTWDPLINVISKRLLLIAQIYHFGGQVVLLNPAFNVISIFYLYFLKMIVKD